MHAGELSIDVKMLWTHMLVVLFIIIHWLSANVVATHFRGGIIMVKPVVGGALAEVRHKTCKISYKIICKVCKLHSMLLLLLLLVYVRVVTGIFVLLPKNILG